MYLGIDLGTSEVKVLLLDTQHHIVATAGQALDISRPHALWSEQRPADWWAALDRALPEVSSHTRESLLMRHGSVDYLGAEQRSLEELRERGLPTCEATPAGDAPWTTYVVRHAHP